MSQLSNVVKVPVFAAASHPDDTVRSPRRQTAVTGERSSTNDPYVQPTGAPECRCPVPSAEAPPCSPPLAVSASGIAIAATPSIALGAEPGVVINEIWYDGSPADAIELYNSLRDIRRRVGLEGAGL